MSGPGKYKVLEGTHTERDKDGSMHTYHKGDVVDSLFNLASLNAPPPAGAKFEFLGKKSDAEKEFRKPTSQLSDEPKTGPVINPDFPLEKQLPESALGSTEHPELGTEKSEQAKTDQAPAAVETQNPAPKAAAPTS